MKNKRTFVIFEKGVRRVISHSVPSEAAELAYYLLFSLFPLLIFLAFLLGRFNMPIQEFLLEADALLPQEVIDLLLEYLDYLSRTDSLSLFISSIGLTFYTWARSIRSLTRSVSKAYDAPKRKRAYIVSFFMSALLIVSILVLLVFTIVSGNIYERLETFFNFSDRFTAVWDLIGELLVPALMFLVLTAFYQSASGKGRSFILAMPGTAFFMVIWFIATHLFSYYVGNVGRYNLLYGSLGTVMILLVWLQLTASLLIYGGELNAIIIDLTSGTKLQEFLESSKKRKK